MQQVAIQSCQIRNELGKVITVYKNQVVDYDEEHPFLRPIEGSKAKAIKFETAGEDELFEAEYDLADLKEFIKTTFEVPVRVKTKKKLIEKLLDCRYRVVDVSELNRLD